MLNLLKIEMKKMKLGWYVRGAAFANFIILGFLWMVTFTEGKDTFQTIDETFLVIGTFVRAVFIIFGAVLISKLIISEFKNKTILVMFTYPINRKKLLAAKLLIAAGLTFITILISNACVAAAFFLLNSIYGVIPGELTASMVSQQALKMIVFAFGAAGTSLVPIFFGMRKHSAVATIISSVVISMLISSTSPDFSISSIVYIPLSLAAVGLIFSFLAVRRIEKIDVF
ncbi:ABC transporter permease [Bacillus paralicheniformis]|uniref:ABC transporter permease n=1 Tax=Bacillus TaxID=1386 RepID=UPI0011AB5F01|nr:MULTISPECIES: ABC transporter permease [Bacillus]MCD2368371.1 ABC transporter permease [Bacillus sp. BS3(2021)]MCJ8229764.1 ABC transporter permease [Bacillus paralicheniformis]MCQ5456437.1 ABC transporter permease [Bacillus paralicheniformis]MCU4666270.1 ABC transporter permease [Bacillus paralicheniformis]MDU0414033.1 ABC transporter permease [Bacillus paralicheniformis]